MRIDRRGLLALGAGSAATVLTNPVAAAEPQGKAQFTYCFNTSTIRGQKLSLVEEIDIAAKAGYDGIEPWLRKIDAYKESGGSLKDLSKRLKDHGLKVESAIGFAQWIVDDEKQRAKGLEQAKRDMDSLRQIGGLRIAAPPAGATNKAGLNLFAAAERYAKLLELGDKMDVVPQVEVWGFSKNLSRLGETVFVAVESGHPKACVLPDVYHIFKGGSDFEGLNLLSGPTIQVFHMNDYPANPPREQMKDADRVYPGDGVAPVTSILKGLQAKGSPVALSLELFNPTYWTQDALEVAKTGLAKMKAAVAKLG
ncbi:MAG: sugar phosphate isomerase/epimerase family protein [Planctomycetaceae bacterium]